MGWQTTDSITEPNAHLRSHRTGGPLTPGFILHPCVDGITGGGWVPEVHVANFTAEHIFVPRDERHFHLKAVLHKHGIGHRHNVFILLGDDGLVDLF